MIFISVYKNITQHEDYQSIQYFTLLLILRYFSLDTVITLIISFYKTLSSTFA